MTDTNNVRLCIVGSSFDGFDSLWHTHPGLVVVQVKERYFRRLQTGLPQGVRSR